MTVLCIYIRVTRLLQPASMTIECERARIISRSHGVVFKGGSQIGRWPVSALDADRRGGSGDRDLVAPFNDGK
jgi:hypothetical protein